MRSLSPRGRIQRLFVVARDTGYRQRLARCLLTRFATVTCVEGRYRALLHHVLDPADAVLFEGKPNEPRLAECVQFLRSLHPATAVVLLASRIDIHDAVRILEAGADDVAFRPINFVEFPHRLAGHVRRRTLPSAPDPAFDPLDLLAACRERLATTLPPLEPDDLERALTAHATTDNVAAALCLRLWQLDRLFRVDRASVGFAPDPPSPLLERMREAPDWEAFAPLLREHLATLSPSLCAPHPDRSGASQRRDDRRPGRLSSEVGDYDEGPLANGA